MVLTWLRRRDRGLIALRRAGRRRSRCRRCSHGSGSSATRPRRPSRPSARSRRCSLRPARADARAAACPSSRSRSRARSSSASARSPSSIGADGRRGDHDRHLRDHLLRRREPLLAGATTSLLLAFILAVCLPGPVSSIPDRLVGWGLASAGALIAVALLWPAPARDPVRSAAIAACARSGRGCGPRSPTGSARPTARATPTTRPRSPKPTRASRRCTTSSTRRPTGRPA